MRSLFAGHFRMSTRRASWPIFLGCRKREAHHHHSSPNFSRTGIYIASEQTTLSVSFAHSHGNVDNKALAHMTSHANEEAAEQPAYKVWGGGQVQSKQ
jgi:hypothetical protein